MVQQREMREAAEHRKGSHCHHNVPVGMEGATALAQSLSGVGSESGSGGA